MNTTNFQPKLPGLPPGIYHEAIAEDVKRGNLKCLCDKRTAACSCGCDCGNLACDPITEMCCWCLWATEMENL